MPTILSGEQGTPLLQRAVRCEPQASDGRAAPPAQTKADRQPQTRPAITDAKAELARLANEVYAARCAAQAARWQPVIDRINARIAP
jgi:hypothetical protein